MALILREIDLHGMTVNEALYKLEQDLSAMYSRGVNELLIIHGKGEGILRTEVLRYLKSGACSGFLSGVFPGGKYKLAGGDGVVKVTFRVGGLRLQREQVRPLKKLQPEPEKGPDEAALLRISAKRDKGRQHYEKMKKRKY